MNVCTLAHANDTRVRVLNMNEDREEMLVAELQEGQYYEFEAGSEESLHIIANQAVLLAQFCKGISS